MDSAIIRKTFIIIQVLLLSIISGAYCQQINPEVTLIPLPGHLEKAPGFYQIPDAILLS